MTILHRTRREVKSARPVRPFGEGILAPAPRPRHTAADEAWWVENTPTRHFGYEVLIPAPRPIRGGSPAAEPTDAEWDAMADLALAQARLDMGLCF